ncbi:hypothetical protein ENHAE0001_1961 [Enhydrobacter aerosaccus SK60]|nr:hypothetical protein ENHAE0001_1961 [Enhydrobacter aerosaccus SK60]
MASKSLIVKLFTHLAVLVIGLAAQTDKSVSLNDNPALQRDVGFVKL